MGNRTSVLDRANAHKRPRPDSTNKIAARILVAALTTSASFAGLKIICAELATAYNSIGLGAIALCLEWLSSPLPRSVKYTTSGQRLAALISWRECLRSFDRPPSTGRLIAT
jgi:hypothetical protein